MLVELKYVEVEIEADEILFQALRDGGLSVDDAVRICEEEAGTQEVLDSIDDEDIKNAEVTTPNGIGKSATIQTFIQREKTGPIPGSDKTYRKSIVKTVVNSREYVYPKTKRKALEQKLTDALLNV